MKSTVCFTVENGAYPIVLSQQGRDKFTVQYGKQIDKQLTYGQACTALGQAIMHKLSCDGDVDNRMPGEK